MRRVQISVVGDQRRRISNKLFNLLTPYLMAGAAPQTYFPPREFNRLPIAGAFSGGRCHGSLCNFANSLG
jgi:hypothetical protein